MKRPAQATKPDHWRQRWIVSGWFDEQEHAQRVCDVVGYERDVDGREVVRVVFTGQQDLFVATEALLSPHQLLPYRPDPVTQ